MQANKQTTAGFPFGSATLLSEDTPSITSPHPQLLLLSPCYRGHWCTPFESEGAHDVVVLFTRFVILVDAILVAIKSQEMGGRGAGREFGGEEKVGIS